MPNLPTNRDAERAGGALIGGGVRGAEPSGEVASISKARVRRVAGCSRRRHRGGGASLVRPRA
eukprot:9975563-Alexandrium_andersonii.AAC.1